MKHLTYLGGLPDPESLPLDIMHSAMYNIIRSNEIDTAIELNRFYEENPDYKTSKLQ